MEIKKKTECEHKWKEDEMMACGAIVMMAGTIDDMGEETKVVCEKCGAMDFVPKNFLKRINLLENF